MADPSDAELVRRWKDEPAPLLPVLHAFHDRDGYVSDEAIRSISAGLKTPLADLFGTVSVLPSHFPHRPVDSIDSACVPARYACFTGRAGDVRRPERCRRWRVRAGVTNRCR